MATVLSSLCGNQCHLICISLGVLVKKIPIINKNSKVLSGRKHDVVINQYTIYVNQNAAEKPYYAPKNSLKVYGTNPGKVELAGS